MFILKKGHQPGVYVPLRALFLVLNFSEIHIQLTFRLTKYCCTLLSKMTLILSPLAAFIARIL